MSNNTDTFISRLRELPKEKREAYAAVYLKELEDDARWEELFASTSSAEWRNIAKEMKGRKN